MAGALVVHWELDFATIYVDALGVGQVIERLRSLGFDLHHLHEISTRRMVHDDLGVHHSATRVMWGDGVFVPTLSRLHAMDRVGILNAALVLNDCYAVHDLAYHYLLLAEAHRGTHFALHTRN